MPSITFQTWRDLVSVRRIPGGLLSIEAVDSDDADVCIIATPSEARKLATMLNETADRVEEEQ